MAITEVYEMDGVGIAATEISIVSGTSTLQSLATPGVYQLWFDATGLSDSSETYIIRGYEKVRSGGTKRVSFSHTIKSQTGVDPGNIAYPSFALMHGWDFTVQRIDGSLSAPFDASVRRIGASAAVTEAYGMTSVTVGTTELSVISGTTTLQSASTPGIYQFWVDGFNMARGDDYRIRVYEKVEATGGTKRVCFSVVISDVQTELFMAPAMTLMHGFDFTIQKLTGTDRAFSASVRKIG